MEQNVLDTGQYGPLAIEITSVLDNNAPPPLLGCGSVCSFSQQHNDVELEKTSSLTRKLTGLIILYSLTMAIEIIGGIKSSSLAVLTDAAHMFSDVVGFAISLFAVWASGWKPTSHQSFGFYRLEVIAALLSVQLIWLITGILVYEAIDRILHKSRTIDGSIMFLVAAFGFLINLTMVIWLGHNHLHHGCGAKDHHHSPHHQHHHHRRGLSDEETSELVSHSHATTNKMNINLEGAYLHVVTDMIQSIGVMIAGAIIWAKPKWVVIDLICTLLFSVLVLISTLPLLINVFSILMERAPREIDIIGLENDLISVAGVSDVHDLHVWSITAGKVAMSCHVIVEVEVDSKEILHVVRKLCQKNYQINHVTVQVEQE